MKAIKKGLTVSFVTEEGKTHHGLCVLGLGHGDYGLVQTEKAYWYVPTGSAKFKPTEENRTHTEDG